MIYRQQRVGKDGREFTMLKIETMRDGVVTRPFLRRSGLDELPQLWNVLRGDMALFGPRPEEPAYHDVYSHAIGPVWDERLRVKPGILSLAAVAGRIRGPERRTIAVKTEQAVLDNLMIDGGLRVRSLILRRLPSTMLRGQRDEEAR